MIIDLLNTRDSAGLKAMFTEHTRANYSTEIDKGLEYLLSLFPNGDIVLRDDPGGTAVYERIDGGKTTVLMPSFYRVSSGGVDYRLFFADFTENTIDPDNVGIYALGAVPVATTPLYAPEAYLYQWSNKFFIGTSAPPGIFIPQ